MKKTTVFLITCILFVIVPIASAFTITSETNLQSIVRTKVDTTGTFTGEVGYKDPKTGEKVVVATISGSYTTKQKVYTFTGSITSSKDPTKTGTVKGVFKKSILIGKIIGGEKSLPIVGFIGFKESGNTFGGRAMSIVGPALYFWGTYTQ